METKYPSCGILLTGDFNKLPTQQLTRHFHLKQTVDFPIRGSSKLDLILTNLADFYDKPYSIPPFGLSDHLTILAFPNIRTKETRSKKVIYVRDKRPSSIRHVGKFLSEVPWDLWYPPIDHVKKT